VLATGDELRPSTGAIVIVIHIGSCATPVCAADSILSRT
jgi:hypothetical protein